MRYKGIPHRWVIRHRDNEGYTKVAKIPIVPAVRLPDGKGLQDSTPIMEYVARAFPAAPSTHPPDQPRRFVSELLEEAGR